MPCTRQRNALGGSRYSPAHANRLRAGLHPRPAPRGPARRAPRGRLRRRVHRQGVREAGAPARTGPGLAVGHRTGDQLVITKLDRLGRSLEHLIELSKDLQGRGVDLVVLDQGIDTSTPAGRMFFQILGAIAEFEHALMSERTRDGLVAARARGRTGGQKPKLTPRQAKLARAMYDEQTPDGRSRYTVVEIAAEFGVTRPTIYRHLQAAATPATKKPAGPARNAKGPVTSIGS